MKYTSVFRFTSGEVELPPCVYKARGDLGVGLVDGTGPSTSNTSRTPSDVNGPSRTGGRDRSLTPGSREEVPDQVGLTQVYRTRKRRRWSVRRTTRPPLTSVSVGMEAHLNPPRPRLLPRRGTCPWEIHGASPSQVDRGTRPSLWGHTKSIPGKGARVVSS